VSRAQITLETARTHRAALPTAFLHQLIKHGEAWQEFFQSSMKSSLDAIMTSQREADRVFREWAARSGWTLPGAKPAAAPAPERKAEAAGEADALRGEGAALRGALRALEGRLGKRRRGWRGV